MAKIKDEMTSGEIAQIFEEITGRFMIGDVLTYKDGWGKKLSRAVIKYEKEKEGAIESVIANPFVPETTREQAYNAVQMAYPDAKIADKKKYYSAAFVVWFLRDNASWMYDKADPAKKDGVEETIDKVINEWETRNERIDEKVQDVLEQNYIDALVEVSKLEKRVDQLESSNRELMDTMNHLWSEMLELKKAHQN